MSRQELITKVIKTAREVGVHVIPLEVETWDNEGLKKVLHSLELKASSLIGAS